MVKQDVLRTYNLIKGNRIQKLIGCYRSPGVHAVVVLRFGQWLKSRNIVLRILLEPLYAFLNYRIKSNWGIEIPRAATIGEGFYIGHFGGITISSEAKIGRNVNISQLVTIGRSGRGEKCGCPTIGDSVYIASGAKLFGKIKIGNNVKVGANAVVYKDVPDNAIIAMSPGYEILSYEGNRSVDQDSEKLRGRFGDHRRAQMCAQLQGQEHDAGHGQQGRCEPETIADVAKIGSVR